jgi:hypothetical protein
MPRRSKHTLHADAMRRDIASLAARLMAEDGIGDYGLAKRKAAKKLRAPDSEALPTNQEIEQALRAYQAVFQEEELRERLRALRQNSLALMRELEEFHPYLTGPALEGTAGRYAEAEIELFADSAKDVEIFLLDRGTRFEHADIRRTGPDSPEARLRLDSGDVTLLLSVYPRALERSHRRNPHTGQVAARARADAVAALLDEHEPPR